MDPRSFLFLSSVSRVTGHTSKTTKEIQGRSTPWVTLYGQLTHPVDVLTRPTEVFVSPSKLDRTKGSVVWLEVSGGVTVSVLSLCELRYVKSLYISDLDELGPPVCRRGESFFGRGTNKGLSLR